MYHFFKNNKTNKYFVYFLVLSFFNSGYFAYSNQLLKNYIKVKWNPQAINHYVGNALPVINPTDTFYNEVASKTDNKKEATAKVKFVNTDNTNMVFASDIKEGNIGISKKGDFDFIYDNIFKVNINDKELAGKEIYLSYDIKGIDKSTLPSRSINFNKVVGGYVVKFSNEWQNVEEKMSAAWLKNGVNTIFFTLPNEAVYNYKIKNLKIFTKAKSENHIIELKNLIAFKNDNKNIYLNGFINLPSQLENSGYTLTANDKPVNIIENQFEEKFANVANKEVVLKLFHNNIIVDIIEVKAAQFIKADRNYNVEPLDAKTSVASNVVAAKNYAEYESKKHAIAEVRLIDIPQFESSFINVTKNKTAYRVTNLKVKDSTAFKLFMEYDASLIPNGYTEKDIQTFHFDADYKKWIPVEKDSLMVSDNVVVALSDKEGDYVNGIIQVPESPQTSSFTPTMMSDIKAADPAAEMTIISPPEVSQKGEANISYPIKIPAGRNGVQPNVSINYSSDGGNGWLGEGWGISTPAITIDTKWGVPTFDSINESEIYNLNGEQLMYPKSTNGEDWMPNRHQEINGVYQTVHQARGTTEKEFTPRKQGSFAKIERLGSTTSDYTWKVTSTDGTVSWYGGKNSVLENAVIKDADNNIVHWALYMVEDVHGNNIKYSYDNYSLSGQTGNYENLNEGKIFNIKEIFYTGYNENNGIYSVEFLTDNTAIRSNPIINAKNGLKQIDVYLLKQINIKNNHELIRNYKFNYSTGRFNKTLLESVAEFDKNGNEFYKHKFEYYDDLIQQSEQDITLFEKSKSITLPSLSDPAPSFSLGVGLLGASRLNTTQTIEAGWEVSPAIGFEVKIRNISQDPNKTFMFNLPFGASYPRSRGIISMADIDGNGLEDIIYKHANGLSYRPCYFDMNSNEILYGSTKAINGIDSFYRSKGTTQNKIFQSWAINYTIFGHPLKPKINLGSRRFISKNFTDIYFTDGNGDGLIDIVKNDQVVFNEGLFNNDSNVFSTSSENTPNMLITASKNILPEVPDLDPIDDESAYEVVRVWVAPKDGTIKITDMLEMIGQDNNSKAKYAIETSKNTINNGIPFRLYYKELDIYNPNHTVSITNYNGNNPLLGSNNSEILNVVKNQRIYFRLNYLNKEDGTLVNSNPMIQYLNISSSFLLDENLVNHQDNSYSNAYLLNDNQPYYIPASGMVKFEWDPIIINSVSDDVTYKITQVNEDNNNETETVIYKKTLYASTNSNNVEEVNAQYNEVGNSVSIPFLVSVCPASREKPACKVNFKFEVYSDSNQKWNEIQWKPKMSFTPDVITDSIFAFETYPVAYHSVYKSTFTKKMMPEFGWKIPKKNILMVYGIKPKTAINIGESVNGVFYMIVKRNGLLVGKTQISVVNGDVYSDNINNPIIFQPAIDINNLVDQFEYTVGFYTEEKENSNVIEAYINATNNQPAYVFWDNNVPENSQNNLSLTIDNCYNSLGRFGSMYKEWGQFFYNDHFDNSTTIPSDIKGKLLNVYHIDRTDNIDPSTLPNFSECNTVATENTLEDYENCVSSSISTSENLENVNPENISEVTTNPMFNLINIVFLSANAIRNYQNQIEVEKWKGLFETQFSSPTKFKSGNFTGSEWDTVFPDEDMSQDTVIQANLETGMPAITKIHRSVSVSKHKSFSILIESLNSNFTKSESRYSLEIQNFMDINGDLYPEIITSDNVLFTNKRGGFTNMLSHNYGYINSSENFAKRAATNGKGIALGREKIGAEGKKTDRGNVFSEINVSPQLSINYFNNNKDNLFWLDVNGDGLLDQIKEENNEVKFNLNKGNLITSDFKNFSLLRGRETRPELVSLSLNAGLNLNNLFQDLPLQVNISGGYSNQGNVTKTAFQDLNGDGLVDLLLVNNGEGRYYVNTGNGFSNQSSKLNYRVESEIEFVRDNNNSSVSLGAEISKFFRIYSWPPILRVLHIKAGGSISGNANLSLSHANKSFKDFNGDGFVDYIERDGNNLNVYYSRIKRTNKLKMVTNPLGGTFTVDYKVQPVTFDNPHPKWAMSSIEVSDNYDNVNDGEDTYKKHFEYKDGKYDRREREFYGYKEVRVLDYTTNDAGNEEVYRTNVTKYNNSSYFLNGLATENYTLKGNDENQKYNRTVNTYKVYALTNTNNEIQLNNEKPLTYDVGGKEGRRSAAVLLTKTRSEVYELNPTPGLVTEIEFTYDSKGRIKEYVNKGDLSNTTDDYKSVIKYHEIPSLNIISIPKSIEVTVLDTNTVKRMRNTEINPANGKIIKVGTINGNEAAVTEMEYDQYGNLLMIKYPENTAHQSMSYTYTYDTTYHKYVEKVTDNVFGHESTTLYNYNFDKPKEVTDIAGNTSKYFYDDFGRTTRIVAPKEDNNSDLDYTIKFEYYPYINSLPSDAGATITNFMPVAVTQHFDVQHPDNPIETFTFVDGLGRPAQVKKDIELNSGDTTSPSYIEALTISGKTKVDKYARTIEAFQPWWEEKNPSSKFIINEQAIDTSSKVIYDELDRAITTIDEEGNTATVQFAIAADVNGINCLKTTSDVDQNGAQHVISETYHDASGKLLSTKNVGGISGSIWTKFKYNAIGELLTYTDAENITTKYTYDMLGRKVEVNHPDKGTTRYKYDNVNLIEVQTQNLINENKFIKYKYYYNRLMSVVFPEMPNGENLSNVDYEYGDSENQTGRVITIHDATGFQKLKYGVMGETIEIDRTIVAPNLPTRNFKTTFDYDSFNRIQKLIYPDGESLSYLYNRGGNVNQMITQLNGQEYEYVKQIDYDYFEQKTYMKYGNNTETFYNYSPELRRLQNLNVKASDGQSMFNNNYKYDKVGNVKQITNNAEFNTTNYMGGVYENIYDYDNLNRLIRAKGGFTGFISRGTGHNLQAYKLDMAYNDTHGIIKKSQTHTSHGYLPVYENTYSNKYKYLENTHKTLAISNVENGTVDEFKYDDNGNMIVNSNSNNFREMFWDESNRLRVVYDQNSYQMQHYIYDAAGERTLKASSKIENVYENGQVESNNTTMGLYTTYVSPYMVVDANQKYSKHYFNGTQRVASKIGEQDIKVFENGNQYLKQTNSKAAENTPSTDFDTLKNKQITDFSYYVSKSTNTTTAKNLKINYTEYKKVDTNTETTSAKAADNNSAFAAQQYAEIYYYHSDHLGTGTFLSDFDGNPYQFFLNLPFGETMAEQHSYSGEYTNRYKFNGKELDEETGFYYYGARYYNPKFSIWLSTDPLAEKYPNFNPYSYCYQNPINFIDPTGMEGDDWYENKLTGEIKWFDDNRSECSDNKGNDWNHLSSDKNLSIDRNGKHIDGFVSKNGKSNLFFWDIVNNVKDLAQSLIDSKKVTFGSLHPSPSKPIYKDDKANAIDNIIDAANGKLVYTSEYGHAKGVQVDIKPELLTMLNKLADKYSFSISEIAGARHGFGSRHYSGIAVDITSINGKNADINNPFLKSFMKDARNLGATEVLGPPTENHNGHVHLGMPRN
jgi:RHS repeat-associated protein